MQRQLLHRNNLKHFCCYCIFQDFQEIENGKTESDERRELDDDDDGLPAYSHHDKIPPWWGNVINDKGGNVSVSNSHHT